MQQHLTPACLCLCSASAIAGSTAARTISLSRSRTRCACGHSPRCVQQQPLPYFQIFRSRLAVAWVYGLVDFTLRLWRVRPCPQSDCEVSAEPGKAFRMFSGNIEGENVEIAQPTKIVQKWCVQPAAAWSSQPPLILLSCAEVGGTRHHVRALLLPRRRFKNWPPGVFSLVVIELQEPEHGAENPPDDVLNSECTTALCSAPVQS